MKKYLLRRLGVAHDPGATKPSLQACIEVVLEQSDAVIDDVIAGLQLATSEAHSKKGLHARQNPQRRAVVEALAQQKKEFQYAFSTALRSAVYGGTARHQSTPARVRFDDFQFLEEEQIDANIELAMTEQEVLLSVDTVLPAFNGLVSSLLGWSSVQAHLNPLKPENFVYALRESLAQCIPADEARAGVMGPAASLLGAALAQLYREMVDWLRSQGVEPVVPLTGGTGPFGAPVKGAENSVTRTLLTLDKLRRLLSGELDPSGAAAGAKDFTHTVPASFEALEDMKLVEPMMKRLAERARLANPEGLPGAPPAVAPRVSKEAVRSKALGQQLGEEVVRLMLDNLMQDRRMLPGIRQNLKAMEPVLLRLSHTDPRFFSERKHPARHFLDKITSRSLAFTSVEEPGFTRFQKTLDNAVSVLSGGEGDANAFARLLRKLEDGWAQEEHQHRQRAEEAARSLLHAEQRNMLAQRLSEEFMGRVGSKRVPELVVTFLRGPWAQVVAESQLRCADGSQDADGYFALVDDLIWSVQLRLTSRNRARLVDMVPQMLVKLRQGLQRIDYPEDRIPPFFDGLISIHEQAFEAGRVVATEGGTTPALVPRVDAAELQVPDDDELWMADDEVTDSGFMRDSEELPPSMPDAPQAADPALQNTWAAESLGTGSWVDLALDGVWVRAQLTWASPHRTLFMFTSAGGGAHSMSRRTMDRLRDMGLIHLVSDGHVMDNALDAVAQAALRNDLEKGEAST
ncbi:DUF1631 family protein [Rhodoferax sp. TS-BS-61-7]|uniref:DUF1631 family protein n=1 Tax=Rhodoferax sp. TS-BS-61-7 TaxID=2094194 RepID=UPI000CF6FA1A|nr:DUF1631 family protein [Rhodoferax sp. TS-BS-61-7]PQA76100.1 hypothetical protein C5F53_16790 [Rhodoferax sp. TS-BS-61-7]